MDRVGQDKSPHGKGRSKVVPMVIVFALVGFSGFSQQTNSVVVEKASAKDEITTLDGTTYKSIRILKVEPDGLVLEHQPPAGGVGLAKLKFEDLPAELKQKHGYDPEKAGAYEAKQAEAELQLRAEMQAQQAQAWAILRQREEDNFNAIREREERESAARRAEEYATTLAPLIDPATLATLGERGVGPQVQKTVAMLADAEANKADPGVVCEAAINKVRMKPAAGELTKAALLRNLNVARQLGCLDEAGLADLRRGQYKGEELTVDFIIPRAVCPELDSLIANLELVPKPKDSSTQDKVGERQVSHAEQLHAAGLLSSAGLERVRRAAGQ